MAKDPQNHRSATDASWRLHSILYRKNLCWRFLSRPVGMSGLPHPSLPADHGVESREFRLRALETLSRKRQTNSSNNRAIFRLAVQVLPSNPQSLPVEPGT